MIEIPVSSTSAQLREARHSLRDRLDLDRRLDPEHVDALESVAGELLGAAVESGVAKQLVLSVALFARLTSVRVRCPRDVDLRDEPFGIRERVLQGLALAWGKRSYADGSVDLWAEVARPVNRDGPV